MNSFEIKESITIDEIEHLLKSKTSLTLSNDSKNKVIESKNFLDKFLDEATAPIYGVNTGFGSLYDQTIDDDKLSHLQENLLLSHACGMGNTVPDVISKIMLLLKVQSLSYGHSAVQMDTVNSLMNLFNNDILPVIYEKGSLGASGDLAPLAHMALPLIGKGDVRIGGDKFKTEDITKDHIRLEAKEGLALINGTQFMSSYGVYCLMIGEKLMTLADTIAAMSVDAFDGRPEPFSDSLHQIRPHDGQIKTAENIRNLLEGSELFEGEKVHVQDPYSFRCVPQVHGASKDVLKAVKAVIQTEINSVTDNPNVFPEDNTVLSGGNFHGQTLALHLDFLAMGFAELANISERRIYKLISGERGLPAFLVKNPGLNSGFMIPQYTAASIVSKNKTLCHPASVDSIVSSNGQEDHVSMGANSAVKCLEVLNNTIEVLAVELFVATQALDFRRPNKSSEAIEALHADFRKSVAFVENDEFMHPELVKCVEFLNKELGINELL
jgi:histidine ammonia-lyase